MTNAEKYKTYDERRSAFSRFCWMQSRCCSGCPFEDRKRVLGCYYAWLQAKAW